MLNNLLSLFFFSSVILTQAFQWNAKSSSSKLDVSPLKMAHFEEAMIGNTLLTVESLKGERYLAMNRFKVRKNAMPKFEKRWADRKSRLATLEGFRFFSLLRRVPAFGVTYEEEEEMGNYISFTYWQNKDNFDAWRTGDAFKEAHGGGISAFIGLLTTALFIIKGTPKPAFYDALLVKNGERLQFANDNGWRSIKADGNNYIPSDIFMVQSKYEILPGKEVIFEQQWKERESVLIEKVPGFVGFSILRRDADKADDGFNYITSTIWKNMESFDAFKKSESFQKAHQSASIGEEKCYEKTPQLTFYEGKLTLSSDAGI